MKKDIKNANAYVNPNASINDDPSMMDLERKYLDFRSLDNHETVNDKNYYSVLVEYDYHNGTWKEKFVKIAQVRGR